jgi:hypothetical protein
MDMKKNTQKYHYGKRDYEDDEDDYYNIRRRKRGGFLEDLFDFG